MPHNQSCAGERGEHKQEGRQNSLHNNRAPRVNKGQDSQRFSSAWRAGHSRAQDKVGWLGKVWPGKDSRVHKVLGFILKTMWSHLAVGKGVTHACVERGSGSCDSGRRNRSEAYCSSPRQQRWTGSNGSEVIFLWFLRQSFYWPRDLSSNGGGD